PQLRLETSGSRGGGGAIRRLRIAARLGPLGRARGGSPMILHEIITTEKVPFTYRVAGIGPRFLAWLADFGLLLVLLLIGACFASVIEMGRAGLGAGVFLAALFAVQFVYFIFFEWLWHGQTPGKYLLGIRVVSWEGTGISFLQSAGRNILRMADGL